MDLKVFNELHTTITKAAVFDDTAFKSAPTLAAFLDLIENPPKELLEQLLFDITITAHTNGVRNALLHFYAAAYNQVSGENISVTPTPNQGLAERIVLSVMLSSNIQRSIRIVEEALNDAQKTKLSQPEYDPPSDGCDHEGFKGGCFRFGHSPDTCPYDLSPLQIEMLQAGKIHIDSMEQDSTLEEADRLVDLGYLNRFRTGDNQHTVYNYTITSAGQEVLKRKDQK